MQFQRHGFEGHQQQFPGQVEYLAGWQYQREVHAQVAAGEIDDQCLFVEHQPVYTAGRRTLPQERPFDGTPVVDVDRGGKITWHGPGQLVGYPIVRLPDGVGVVDYVRRVEEAIIRYLGELGLPTGRIPERTGVWLPAAGLRGERKICAIGIRVSKRTTVHGFALNLFNDPIGFGNIVPCGITDAGVTRLADELPTTAVPSLGQAADALEPHLRQLLAFEAYRPSPDLEHTRSTVTGSSSDERHRG